jgi:hypothetical protein
MDSSGATNDSTPWTWTVDVAPSCKVTPEHLTPNEVFSAPFNVRMVWSEPVQGFSAQKVKIGGVRGTITRWQASEDLVTFTATVVPAGDRPLSISHHG